MNNLESLYLGIMQRHLFNSGNLKLFAYFIGLSIIGSVVFQIPNLYKTGIPVPYIDGLFTSVSALCVTGLSTVDMSVYTPVGFVAILVLIEAGGLGLVSFFLLYIAFSSKKMSLVSRKIVRDFFIDDVEFNPRKIILRIAGYTFLIQGIGSILLGFELKITGEPHNWFYGIFLSISAFCNAGFSPYSDSLKSFSSNVALPITICVLIVVGGLGFTVLRNITQCLLSRIGGKHHYHLTLHSKIVFLMTGILIVAGTILILIAEYCNVFKGLSFGKSFVLALFQSITTRTAGFETVAQSKFSSLTRFITTILMFIGGSPGSIAGGVKTTTFFLAFCFAFCSDPERGRLNLFRRDISREIVDKAVGIVLKSLFFLFIVLCLLCLTERYNIASGVMTLDSILFETVSAFGTVGLSQGITSFFTPAGKFILIVTMFAGRTGIVAMAMELRKSNSLNKVTDYPRETVLVG